jgi:rhomboid protease GluP
MQQENPINPIPTVVMVLALAMVLVEGALSLGAAGVIGGPEAIGWRLTTLQDYAYAPAVWEQVVARGNLSPDMLKRFVTYLFVHGSFTHVVFALVILLALGKFVGDLWHPVSLLVVFFGAGIFGAVIYGATALGNVPLYGAYPALYGLIGAYTYLMWLHLKSVGENSLRAFTLIAVLLGLQLVWGVLFDAAPHWIADVAGFGFGLAVSPLLGPGGWAAFFARMRERR